MAGLKFTVLQLGFLNHPKYLVIDQEDKAENFHSPMLAWLFEHPTLGKILYDTGNHETGAKYWGAHARETYPVSSVITIKDKLAEIGLTVDDIDILVQSHLHMDHTGGLPYFAGTKAGQSILVNVEDAKQAFLVCRTEEDTGAYSERFICDPGIRFKTTEGETALADDFILFPQKCHTPGVNGIIAKTENHGNFIFVADAIYLKEGFDKNTPPGGSINKTSEEFHNHVKVIRDLQKKYAATIIFGHDPEQYNEYLGKTID
ncbi:MAG: N-acyl homoserine lactonase family protein [Clostridiales Family XIII bacterium]|jgi:glyoxylase-like metal-dependent hydrolase (beta-lactamase superfamily II)|nr:N-acyl homoserine lactonase family protein [Clostridiales Family XIII bacterium]